MVGLSHHTARQVNEGAQGNPVISTLPTALRLTIEESGAAEWIRSTFQYAADELGREVGLSRSALAERFTRLIGVAPMHYLATWRMQVAAQELRNRSTALVQVANQVGYGSEAAFSRAFKKAFGTAPATWRRSRTQAASSPESS